MSDARKIRKHDVAKTSLANIANYLATEGSLKVALRFLERAEDTFQFILSAPGIGHLQEFRSLKLGNVRAWHIRGFRRWLVYYREVDCGIEVIDVLHGAQDQERRLSEKLVGDDPSSPS